MARLSAGLLAFRRRGEQLEVLIVHPGGPFWAKKDAGSWSVPKGEHVDTEDAWAVACREFQEELGQAAPAGVVIDLGVLRQPSGKKVQCFAVEGDVDITDIRSNEFEIEWPPRSGKRQSFPEVDRAAWVTPDAARTLLLKGQVEFVDRLIAATTA
jgi:predicted NUDIX family NTP pyrophosphohydrolase